MLGALLRLFIVVLLLAGLAILFFYAFVVALIVTPILFVLFYIFGRKQTATWWVVRTDGSFSPRPGPHPGPHPGQRPGPGQVIDHDPNDLPPPDTQR